MKYTQKDENELHVIISLGIDALKLTDRRTVVVQRLIFIKDISIGSDMLPFSLAIPFIHYYSNNNATNT